MFESVFSINSDIERIFKIRKANTLINTTMSHMFKNDIQPASTLTIFKL